jgi:hypothetical protein
MSVFGKVSPITLSVAALLSCAISVRAQFNVERHDFQIHGFATQGFAYSNENNYLTMQTSKGSFDFTDAGLNMSAFVTNKFRIGAQAYVRNLGALGQGHVTLDWALGDYRFSDSVGVRAGKVKTVFGLYNDTQDAEFLHTWALLPQSVYPLDLRANSLAHLGGDLYGRVAVPHLGSFAYTAYAGRLSIDRHGGFTYGLLATGLNPSKISGTVRGGDLKWTTPFTGLLLGASILDSPKNAVGLNENFPGSFAVSNPVDRRTIFYGQYTWGNLRLEGEYSRELQAFRFQNIYGIDGPPLTTLDLDRRAWYVAVAYRVAKHLEIGAYNSRFVPNADGRPEGPTVLSEPEQHIFDQTVSARIDLTRFWDLKLEEHFISGYGDPSSFHGFYPQNNPNGAKPNTNLFVLRTGVNF